MSESMRITTAGSVGINTTSPSYLLDVNGTFRSSVTGGSIYTSSAGGIPRLYIGGNGFGFNRQSASEDVFFGEPGDTGTWRVRGAGTISLGVGNTATTMTIVGNNGNVGIGTSSPLSKLDVAVEATLTRRFLVNYDDSILTIKSSNNSSNPETFRLIGDNIRFSTGTSGSGTERARILVGGNFGIGTETPNTKLELRTDTLTAGNEPNITLFNRGTSTTETASYSIGGTYGAAFRDVRNPGYVAGVEFYRDSASAGLNSQGSIRFYAASDAGTLAELRASWERMRLDPTGNLLVGTTTTVSGSNHIVVGSNSIQGFKKDFTNLGTAAQSFGFQAAVPGVYVCSLKSIGGASVAFLISVVFNNSAIDMYTTTLGNCTAVGNSGTIS
jgi:hypothetical protein